MQIREVEKGDLAGLLALYTQLHGNPLPEPSAGLEELWARILRDPCHHIVVVTDDGKIVSSCVIVIIPNLTHAQRPYALVENVITDAGRRGRGYATAALDFAKEIAKNANCYKIMLMTGSKKMSTLNFYQRAGYNQTDKTAFICWLD
jgi:GNAT superfamily N-acetyltransferase